MGGFISLFLNACKKFLTKWSSVGVFLHVGGGYVGCELGNIGLGAALQAHVINWEFGGKLFQRWMYVYILVQRMTYRSVLP